ncbi:MAG: DNA polymerase III subunit delta [Verrucomicrobia bacterium]|nr:DNA polymerase III subunit delta [Verrucomicrobiota bacterium]
MKLDEFRRVLANLRLRPVLLVTGTEPYLKTLIVETLKKHGAEAHGEGFSCRSLYANSHTARQAVNECRAGEFFVTAKMVLLHEIDRYHKDDLGVLAEYVKSPDASSSLVMTAESVDGRTSFAKAVGKLEGGRTELKPMYDNEMPPWIDALAKRRNRRLSRAARGALGELCGTNLVALAAEMDKLDLYVGERELIEEADVAAVVGRSRMETYYRLRDAVLDHDAGGALEIWGMLADEGENVYGLFGRLRMTLRELLNARELADGGAPMAAIGRTLGIPSWRQQAFGAALGRTSVAQLVFDLEKLFDADVDLRRSRLTERQVAERLLVALCAA